MRLRMTRISIAALSILMAGVGVMTAVAADKPGAGMKGSTYYKVHPLFHPFPDEKKALQSIDRFGPVGIGIELLKPAFTMRVKNVEEGSPAAATGKLNKGQWIDSINGRVMEKMDVDSVAELVRVTEKAQVKPAEVLP